MPHQSSVHVPDHEVAPAEPAQDSSLVNNYIDGGRVRSSSGEGGIGNGIKGLSDVGGGAAPGGSAPSDPSEGDGWADGSDHLDVGEDQDVAGGEVSGKGHARGCGCDGCRALTLDDAYNEERKRNFIKQFPEAEFKADADCESDRYNWSDLDVQLNHLSCCYSEEKGLQHKAKLFGLVYKKVHYVCKDGEPGYWNNQRKWIHYDARASILAASDYDKREAFCYCAYHTKKGQSASCQDTDYCPRCCYNLYCEPMLMEYGNCFGADQEVYFITLSFTRDQEESKRMRLGDLTEPEKEQIAAHGLVDLYEVKGLRFVESEHLEQVQKYWEICRRAMRDAVSRNRRFSGAFGSLELAVSFGPLRVTPHAHFIGFSAGLCADDMRKLRRDMRKRIRNCRGIADKLYPSVAVRRIKSKRDYKIVIRYLFKPIPIEQPYGFAAMNAKWETKSMMQLNEETNLFVENLPWVWYGVKGVLRLGICSATSTQYCGKVTPERQKRRKIDQARRKKRRAETAASKKLPLGHPRYARRLSRKEQDAKEQMRREIRDMTRDGELPVKQKRAPFRRRRKQIATAPEKIVNKSHSTPAVSSHAPPESASASAIIVPASFLARLKRLCPPVCTHIPPEAARLRPPDPNQVQPAKNSHHDFDEY
jgi:hypothetical protein